MLIPRFLQKIHKLIIKVLQKERISMAKRVTITIKNDEVLTFLDRKVKEFNDRQTDESEKINRTDYINTILEREMAEQLGLNQRIMLDMNTKMD